MNGVQEAQYDKHDLGEDASRLSPFFIWEKNAQRKAAPPPLMKERTKKKIVLLIKRRPADGGDICKRQPIVTKQKPPVSADTEG